MGFGKTMAVQKISSLVVLGGVGTEVSDAVRALRQRGSRLRCPCLARIRQPQRLSVVAVVAGVAAGVVAGVAVE